jgi:hypothetical protein
MTLREFRRAYRNLFVRNWSLVHTKPQGARLVRLAHSSDVSARDCPLVAVAKATTKFKSTKRWSGRKTAYRAAKAIGLGKSNADLIIASADFHPRELRKREGEPAVSLRRLFFHPLT